MKRVMVAVLGLCVVVGVTNADDKKGEELTDPLDIVKKADAATKAIKTVRYKVSVEGIGSAKSRVPRADGTVLLSGWGTDFPKMFRIDARFKNRRDPNVREATLGSDGQQFYLIDHKSKKAHVGRTWSIWGGNANIARALLTNEFTYPTPFGDEIKGEKHELEGSKMIGDEDCYEVYVKYAVANAEAVWCFSKKDFLPRSRYDVTGTPSSRQEGGQLKIMTEVEADPALSTDAFKLIVPEGYTQTEHPAP